MLPRRSTSRAHAPWRRAVLAIVALGGGAAIAGSPGVAHATAAPGTSAPRTATSGSVTRTTGSRGVVAPNASGPNTAAGAVRTVRGALPTRSTRIGAARTVGQAPHSNVVSPLSPSTLLRNWNGVSSLDSAKANYGLQFEPPDQGLCEGNGFVLEAVNSAYTVYTTAGHVLVGSYNVNDLFNEGGQEFTSDPRCYYEASTNTWFTLILFISGGGGGTQSHFDLGVSLSGDPSKLSNIYRIDTTDLGGSGCPCFGDQPLLGVDQYNIYVSTNEFSILGPQFNGAQIYALDKTTLIAGAAATFFHFAAPNIGGTQAASVQPATSNGTPTAEYFLSALDPNGTNDNRMGVWAITDRNIDGGATPVLSDVLITSELYAFPVPAIQKGSTAMLNQGDDRMQQTQFVGGSVYGELTTAIVIGSDPTVRDGAAWFEVQPSLTGDAISGAVIQNQGYVFSQGNYLIYPALAADGNGRAAMTFTLSGAHTFPSAAYAILGSGHTSFGAPIVASHGTGPYVPFNVSQGSRWGDYSWALLDTVTHTFWFATELVPPLASQTPDGTRNWGTRVFELAVS